MKICTPKVELLFRHFEIHRSLVFSWYDDRWYAKENVIFLQFYCTWNSLIPDRYSWWRFYILCGQVTVFSSSRDEQLWEEIEFLEQQGGVAGVSHHSLLFSKAEVLLPISSESDALGRSVLLPSTHGVLTFFLSASKWIALCKSSFQR